MNAPTTVPDPPCSSVPPITAAEIAWNRIVVGARRVGRDDEDAHRLEDADEPGAAART